MWLDMSQVERCSNRRRVFYNDQEEGMYAGAVTLRILRSLLLGV